jgi:putative DNA primase/helicase
MDTIQINIPEGLDLNSLEECLLPTNGNTTHTPQVAPQQPAPGIREVLKQLLAGLKPIDWQEELGENPKQKHIIVIIVDRVLDAAKARKWGLAKRYDFVYCYAGTYWQQLDKDTLKGFLAEAAEKLGYSSLESRYYEFQNKLLQQFLAVANLPEPEPSAGRVLVNLANGTLEINGEGPKLREHRPQDFLTYCLPFEYSQYAQAPLFQKYLQQVLPQESTRQILAEYLAYCFLPGLKLEKVLLLYGSGANGKSVFYDIVSALLGPSNISSYSLANLSEEHNRAMIADKLLNYGSEINGAISRDLFKLLASGEPVQARLKYGNPFIMQGYARLMFNANSLPADTEHTEAYFRRFVIVPFAVTIPEAQQDKSLAKKIIAQELPGVFAWVLRGLERLFQQQNFSPCDAVAATLQRYRKESDSVAQFLEEPDTRNQTYQPAEEGPEWVSLKQIYSEYKSFSQEAGFRPVSIRTFAERLEKLGFATHKRNVGKVVFCRKSDEVTK